jgi:hypothetical protein
MSDAEAWRGIVEAQKQQIRIKDDEIVRLTRLVEDYAGDRQRLFHYEGIITELRVEVERLRKMLPRERCNP